MPLEPSSISSLAAGPDAPGSGLAGPGSSASALSVAAEPGFDFLGEPYRTLFARSSATAFQDPLWLDRVYRHLVPARGADPLVVVARSREDCRPLLVLPLVRRRLRGLTFVEFADFGLCDYAALVCETPVWPTLTRDAAVGRLVRAALGRHDLLRIHKIRSDAPHPAELLGRATAFPSGSAYSAPLGASFAEWRGEWVTPSRARELDQKRRKLSRKGGLRVEAVSDPALIEPTFAAMRDFRAPRFEGRRNADILTDPAAWAFYLDVARSGMLSGFARTTVLSLGGTPVAAAFGIRHRQRFLTLLSAFDPGYRRYSLGYLLFEAMIEDCIRQGVTEFDLTIGDEPYKRELGAGPTPLASFVQGGSAAGLVGALVLSQPWARKALRRLSRGRPEKPSAGTGPSAV